MHIPVLIEAVPGNGYRARGGEPFAISGEGTTPEAALTQFKESVSAKLQAGAQITSIEIKSSEHSWLPFAGMYQESDPLVQEWLQTTRRSHDESEASE